MKNCYLRTFYLAFCLPKLVSRSVSLSSSSLKRYAVLYMPIYLLIFLSHACAFLLLLLAAGDGIILPVAILRHFMADSDFVLLENFLFVSSRYAKHLEVNSHLKCFQSILSIILMVQLCFL